MSRAILAALLSVVVSVNAINRPVFKIVLTQKGYAQFLQYDVETPPLREFTFCTWIRVYDLGNDQSIFTYVANGNKRVVKLWLDSGGRYMKITIKGKVTSAVRVNIARDVWRHVCLSYQSDFGAWALYVDSRLVSCESAQSLHGYVLPSGGRVIVGYGTGDNGASNGFEGEIFGANMILSSTIERNYTIKLDPEYGQKRFARNKIKKESKDMNYIVLSDLLTDDIHNNFEKPYLGNSTKSYIKFKTPHSFIEHGVGVDISTKNYESQDSSLDHEIFDLTIADFRSTNKGMNSFTASTSNTNTPTIKPSQTELLDSATRSAPTVSEYETPPPPYFSSVYFDKSLSNGNQPITESIYKLKDTTKNGKRTYQKTTPIELSMVETPPPQETNNKVYGQWTSSKFAATVLNYIKKINLKNREQNSRKVPQTIPLYKISDVSPYASDFRIAKLRPPSQFKRRNLVEKTFDIVKRNPQINVQIIEDDLRGNILKMHAETQPKKVEITNRGNAKRHKEHRFYRNVNYNSEENAESLEDKHKPRPFTLVTDKLGKHRKFYQPISNKQHASVLPTLKSSEYDIRKIQNPESETIDTSKADNSMYSKSLSNANKWHNVKSYSNDYTPRRINMDSKETEGTRKLQYPAIRMKYIHEKRKKVEKEDSTIENARKLAMEVSNQSTNSQDSVSILNYNHGYLPAREKNNDTDIGRNPRMTNSKRHLDVNSFNKHVKIGNALNERNVLGENEEQKKQSFIGGYENIPDINRYRSDIDNENEKVPPSLGPRVCKDVELYDRVLYVQQDESIDMTHILSPVREKNIAIEFVIQNYKKCSLTDSSFQKNIMLYIDWSKTPVRLFGGAYPKTTTDLCGFF